MRCNLLSGRHIAQLVLIFALLAGYTAPAVAQLGEDPALPTHPMNPDKGPDPRAELRAEAMLPDVDPDVRRSVIQSDKTLLSGKSYSANPLLTELIEASTSELRAELAAAKTDLASTKKLVGEIIKENRAIAQARELPPLKDAQVRVFQLKNSKASIAAEKVELLFGTQPIRIAVDEASNGLIVFGKAEAIPQVEQLILKLDELAVAGRDGGLAIAFDRDSLPATAARRTLMLRVFWLADGLPDGEGTPTDGILPVAVTNAVVRLGLHKPRLVTQTLNSISVQEGAEPVKFSTNIPAELFEQQVTLSSEGTIAATSDKRVNVEMHLTVGAMDCDLAGSLTTPLGHFMVLGTANSVIPDYAAAGVVGPDGMQMGRGMAGMEGGMGMEMASGDPGMMGAAGPAPAKFNTSRFAFVVQVIEGESFAPAE